LHGRRGTLASSVLRFRSFSRVSRTEGARAWYKEGVERRRRREEEEGSLRTRLRCPSCGSVEREGRREGGREGWVMMNGDDKGLRKEERGMEKEKRCKRGDEGESGGEGRA